MSTASLRLTPRTSLVEAIVRRQRELAIETETDLATRIGTSRMNVANWLAERHTPNALFLPKLAAFLGVSLSEARAMRGEQLYRNRSRREKDRTPRR